MGCWEKNQQPWFFKLQIFFKSVISGTYVRRCWSWSMHKANGQKIRNIVLYSARHNLKLCLPSLQLFIDKNESLSYSKWNLVSVTFLSLSLMSPQWSYVSVIEWKLWTAACLSAHLHLQWLRATHKQSILSEPINNIICTGSKQKCKEKNLT